MNLEEANKLITDLKSIDINFDEGFEKFQEVVTRVIQGVAFKLTLNPHPNLYFVRARKLSNVSDYFKSIDDHSYNKTEPQHIKQGRLNFPKQAIFYAGRIRSTSLAEVNIIENKKEEELVAYGISRWIINKPINLIAVLNPETINELNIFELERFLNFVNESYNSLKGTDNEGFLVFYKYLSEKFTELIVNGEEYKYKLTTTFGNQIFDRLPEIGGLLYQSVKAPDSYNIAIKPKFIDEEYLVPTNFYKQTFIRKNIVDLKEESFEEALSFDLGKNIVEWKKSL